MKNSPQPGKIILLSGTSSSGKSTIAKLLQSRLDALFLHMELDAFIQMLPENHSIDDFYRMTEAFHHAIAAVASTGNNVVVDHVLLDNDWLRQCASLFAPYYVLFVGVDCSLEELERRERTRDVRRQGFARSQFDKIHQGKDYDLLLNTESTSPENCAEQIIDFYNTLQPAALRKYMEGTF